MKQTIKRVVQQVVPKSLLLRGWNRYSQFKARRAREIFEQASETPMWLTWDMLVDLEAAYPLAEETYFFDAVSVEERGREYARTLLKVLPDDDIGFHSFLDLGSWDGMVCYALQEMGKMAVGVDIRSEGLTEKAKQSQVSFSQMDVETLGFAANSFDVVFSYNSFEHFPDPELALKEAIRVVRPDGCIYLNFGPLYFSAKGAHQFTVLSVPYCQCLFSKEMMTEFAQAREIKLVDFHWMNEWSLKQFRQLWDKYAQELERIKYNEMYKADHIDLISRFPSCFKSKTDFFEDLLVSYVEVLFRKK